MLKYIRFAAPLALVLTAACAKKDADTDGALATDSTLNRDLQMANRDSLSQAQLNDNPAATTPGNTPTATRTNPAPRRTPTTSGNTPSRNTTSTTPRTSSGNTVSSGSAGSSGGGGSVGSIAAGSTMNFASGERICTNNKRVGDRFTGSLSESVSGSGGVSIPAGSVGTFEVVELKTSNNSNDNVIVRVRLLSVTANGKSYPVSATTTYANVDKVRSTNNKDRNKVIGGAIIGAVAGQVLGKDTKSTVIGAATGAAAGTVAAQVSADYEGCVPSGSRITVTLDQAAQIRA